MREMCDQVLSLFLSGLSQCQFCPLGDCSFSSGIWLQSPLIHSFFLLSPAVHTPSPVFFISVSLHLSSHIYQCLFLSAFISLSFLLRLTIYLLPSILLSGFLYLSLSPFPFISCYLPSLFYRSLAALISGALAFSLSLSNIPGPLPRRLMLKHSELFCTFFSTCNIYLKAKRQLVNQYDIYHLASDCLVLHFNWCHFILKCCF